MTLGYNSQLLADTRIFSPNLRFVSICGKSVYDCKIKTYETNGTPKQNQSSTKGAKLVRVLVRAVRFTRYIVTLLSLLLDFEKQSC